MNFNFGSANTTGNTGSIFGQQAATGGFGAPNATTTANTGVSLFGSTTPAPAAGTSLFGNNPATSSANTSGFGFGSSATTGNAFASINTAGAFGQNTVSSNPFSTSNTFNTISNTTVTSGAATLGNTTLGANRFGTGFSTGLGAFGNTTTTNVPTPALGAFGTTQPAQQTNTFGFNTGGFGTSSTLGTNTGNAFNTGGSSLFGAKPATTGQFSFNSLGQNTMQQKPSNLVGLSGQPTAAAAQAQREVDPNTFLPKLFNDERDRILGEFNKLQAYWGTGKGYFAPNVPAVEFNQQQSTHKFKAIGFSEIRTPAEDETNKIDVLVKCENGYEQLLQMIPQYETNLRNLFGMNFNVKVENSKPLPDAKAFLSISVVDTNTNKKLPTFQLVAYYEQPHIKQQFQNAFANNFLELIRPLSKQEIEDYLKVPPFGIDPLLWDRAKKENPDPKKFIPVAFVGFGALNARFKSQVQETEQQKVRLHIITEDIDSLHRDVSSMRAKVEECKRRNMSLSNRVLKTMVWQEIKRKKGYPILAEEDELRAKLESIQSELNAPTKYKGCLNELICKLRHMQSQRQITPKFSLDDGLMKELEVHLNKEQQGIEYLLELVKKDFNDLKTIKGKIADE